METETALFETFKQARSAAERGAWSAVDRAIQIVHAEAARGNPDAVAMLVVLSDLSTSAWPTP